MSPRLLWMFVFVSAALLGFAFSETGCPDSWMPYRGHCYMFGNHHLVNFITAEEYCRQHNAYLVHVDNSHENAFIKSQLSIRKGHYYITGLTDEEIEGEWTWYGTGELATFTDWAPGEPYNTNSNEDCVTYEPPNYQWHDVECERLFYAICEKEQSVEIVG